LALKFIQWSPESIVPDLIAMLVPAGAELAGMAAAVEVLRVLPEEAGSKAVVIIMIDFFQRIIFLNSQN
jgi:hypothetical protein